MLSVWFGRVRSAPITVLLFVLCIAVFVAAERTGSTTDIDTLLRFGAAVARHNDKLLELRPSPAPTLGAQLLTF